MPIANGKLNGAMLSSSSPSVNGGPVLPLAPGETAAAREVVRRVQRYIHADLEHALLFGSRARGDARPSSDIDLLLIFRDLPPDREPQAGQAERIADAVAAESGVPVTTWSVALIDLERGRRTPMLVDALADSFPVWPAELPPPRVPFTPQDAVRCAQALLARVAEGSEEVAMLRRQGDMAAAARRARGDVVRLCTAALLLRGETRPRRATAIRRCQQLFASNPDLMPARAIFEWAAESFGPLGQDEDRAVPPPRGGFAAVAAAIEVLASQVRREGAKLAACAASGRNSPVSRHLRL